MPDLTQIKRYRQTTQKSVSPSVQGPAEFIKLALDHLGLPYIYFKPALRVEAATGASFQVRHFDIAPQLAKRYIATKLKLDKEKWLVSKHIAPATAEIREMLATDDANVDEVKLASMVKEMRILSHDPIRSQANIVQLFGFSWEKEKDDLGRRWPIAIMESADCGSLNDFLQLADEPIKTPAFAASIVLDIASGLEAMHGCGIVHGDLKPENILIYQLSRDAFQAKISDFGSALLINDLESQNVEYAVLEGFSPPWEAPEAYEEILLQDLNKVDMYSFRLLVCHLAASGADIFSSFRVPHPLETADVEYDFVEILKLKSDCEGMINHGKKIISSNLCMHGVEGQRFLTIVELCLKRLPADRKDIAELKEILNNTTNIEESLW